MIPHNHTSLVIANERSARAWEAGLGSAGLRAERVPTLGSDIDKGEFYVVVPDSQVLRGQRFVSSVLTGKRSLPYVAPNRAPFRGPVFWGAGAIVLVLLALVLVGWLV